MSSCQTAWACHWCCKHHHLTLKYLCLAQLRCHYMFNPEWWVHLSLHQLVITHPLVRGNLEEPDSAPWGGREPLRAKLAFKPVPMVTKYLQRYAFYKNGAIVYLLLLCTFLCWPKTHTSALLGLSSALFYPLKIYNLIIQSKRTGPWSTVSASGSLHPLHHF